MTYTAQGGIMDTQGHGERTKQSPAEGETEMAITRLFKCKDFTVRGYFGKYQPTNETRYLYKVIYLGEDGNNGEEIANGFFSRSTARKYINQKVKKANAVLKAANKVGKVCLK